MKELSNEELLEIIRKQKTSKSSAKRVYTSSSVTKFIRKYEIYSGDIKIPTYRIYFEYLKKWSQECQSRKLSKVEFFRNFNQHFTQKRNGNQRFYCLNNCMDMSDAAMMEALAYDMKKQRKGVRRGGRKDKKAAE